MHIKIVQSTVTHTHTHTHTPGKYHYISIIYPIVSLLLLKILESHPFHLFPRSFLSPPGIFPPQGLPNDHVGELISIPYVPCGACIYPVVADVLLPSRGSAKRWKWQLQLRTKIRHGWHTYRNQRNLHNFWKYKLKKTQKYHQQPKQLGKFLFQGSRPFWSIFPWNYSCLSSFWHL